MLSDEDRSAVDFLTGLLLGALVGAGAALLLAPRSGRATRRRIARQAEDWSDAASEGLQRAAEETRRLTERARERLEESGDKIGDAVEKGRRRIKV